MVDNYLESSINNVKIKLTQQPHMIVNKKHIDKMLKLSNYRINESSYSLINGGSVYDEIPSLTNEINEPGGDDKDKTPEQDIPPTGPLGNEKPLPEIPVDIEPQNNTKIDELQNEIIRNNVEILKSLNNNIEQLSKSFDLLSNKVNDLSLDVDEVREPTDYEKLMSKKDVSYPYSYNLSDLWDGSWFNKKQGFEVGKNVNVGFSDTNDKIRKLPDGSYIASLNDMDDMSDIDVNRSFDTLI